MPRIKEKSKKDFNTALVLVICLLIVAGTAKGLVLAKDHFRLGQTASAESLPELPDNIKNNQVSYITQEGYLDENYFK